MASIGTIYRVGGQTLTKAQYDAYKAKAAQAAMLPKAVKSGASALYGQRYGEATALLDKLSDQERRDLLARYGALAGQARQGLVNSGLAATTIMPSVMGGIARNQSADLNLLNDQLLQQRLGVMGQYTQGQASAMDSDAARAQQASMARAQMLQGQNQFASQMSYNVARLNSGTLGSRNRYGSTGIRGVVNRPQSVLPGSYSSYVSRYR